MTSCHLSISRTHSPIRPNRPNSSLSLGDENSLRTQSGSIKKPRKRKSTTIITLRSRQYITSDEQMFAPTLSRISTHIPRSLRPREIIFPSINPPKSGNPISEHLSSSPCTYGSSPRNPPRFYPYTYNDPASCSYTRGAPSE